MATVGEITFSMTSPNGSSRPGPRTLSRKAIMPSHLENRSVFSEISGISESAGISGVTLQLDHGIDQLAVAFDFGLLVHADDDVEFVLDRGDEIHHRQAVEFEIAGKGRRIADGDALLVEGRDQFGDFRSGCGAVHVQAPQGSRALWPIIAAQKRQRKFAQAAARMLIGRAGARQPFAAPLQPNLDNLSWCLRPRRRAWLRARRRLRLPARRLARPFAWRRVRRAIPRSARRDRRPAGWRRRRHRLRRPSWRCARRWRPVRAANTAPA